MHPRRSLLALSAAVFALLAGIAGWSWCHLFANPVIGLAGLHDRPAAAACAALAGALAGLLLAPRPPRVEGLPPRPTAAHLALGLAAAGALAGGLLALVHPGADAPRAIGTSAACALSLFPVAALAVAALRRLGEARRGSVVGRAEGRGLIAVLALTTGCSTALISADWPAAASEAGSPPIEAVLVLVAAAVVVAVALLADLAALARVERLAASLDALGDAAPGEADLPAGRVDLGVGDAMVAHPALGTAYRGGGRELSTVIGDAMEAAAALRRSARRAVVMVAVLEGVGFVHGAARGVELAADASGRLCDSGRAEACREAALLAERAGRPQGEAERRHLVACKDGNEESCLALELMGRLAQAR